MTLEKQARNNMKKYYLVKRTFIAESYPKGSKERQELNDNAGTSEYMPSYKWLIDTHDENNKIISSRQFKTKKQAKQFCLDNPLN